MIRRISGQVDYRALAELHRPTDADGLRTAALELARSGLLAGDIAQALQISTEAARQLLQPSTTTTET